MKHFGSGIIQKSLSGRVPNRALLHKKVRTTSRLCRIQPHSSGAAVCCLGRDLEREREEEGKEEGRPYSQTLKFKPIQSVTQFTEPWKSGTRIYSCCAEKLYGKFFFFKAWRLHRLCERARGLLREIVVKNIRSVWLLQFAAGFCTGFGAKLGNALLPLFKPHH